MNQDLKIIKKKYGEKMMHLCREMFSTILDNSPGILSELLLTNFAPNHFLYDDLIRQSYNYDPAIVNFKKYIYELYDNLQNKEEEKETPVPDPKTLMHQAGYTLYECRTEEDIRLFRKYYQRNEELCTFRGGRLNNCYVYFAVKDNAEKLNRQDFSQPCRQDEYGTSVISIQFTKDGTYTLSIKNRYNHTVENPDATFSNNLDNIIPGLTKSFADYYGMKQFHHNMKNFYLRGYVMANDGKFYKYNYEINNVYYCPGNIVINNFCATKYEKEKYLVFDYFILDLVNKKIIDKTRDGFLNTIPNIKKINIINLDDGKIVTITKETGDDVILELNKFNQLISLTDNNLLNVPNNYLNENHYLQQINLPNAKSVGHNFLADNTAMLDISLQNVENIGHFFLGNSYIQQINLPNVKTIGAEFLANNTVLKEISFPNAKYIGNGFLYWNNVLHTLHLPSLVQIGHTRIFKDTDKEKVLKKLIGD